MVMWPTTHHVGLSFPMILLSDQWRRRYSCLCTCCLLRRLRQEHFLLGLLFSHPAAAFSNKANQQPSCSGGELSGGRPGCCHSPWSFHHGFSLYLDIGLKEFQSYAGRQRHPGISSLMRPEGSLGTPPNPGAFSCTEKKLCPRRRTLLLTFGIQMLSFWVDLFPLPTPQPCPSPSFLVFIFIFVFHSPPCLPMVNHWCTLPFLCFLVSAAAAAAAASSSDFRTGPSLWSLSAAHAQRHLPSTLRSVKTPGLSSPYACLFH